MTAFTEKDIATLIKMKGAHRSAKEIAIALGKSVQEVNDAWYNMGKSEPAATMAVGESPLDALKKTARMIILKELKKTENVRLGELSRLTHLAKEDVVLVIDEIQRDTGLPIKMDDSGYYHVERDFDGRSTITPIDIENLHSNTIKIGVVSDTHLCSRYQQLSILHTAYEDFERQGVDFAVHGGDLVDGSPEMHVGMMHEQFVHTFEGQIDYVAEHYPKTDKFKTYIRRGNHDESWIKSNAGDPVRMVCQKREDLIYLDPSNSAFRHAGSAPLVQVYHPSGGNPYAKSYRGQRLYDAVISKSISDALGSVIQESHSETNGMSAGIHIDLPHCIVIGHLHVFNMFLEGATHVINAPCLQSQTPYLLGKQLSPFVGYMTLEFEFDDSNNIIMFTPHIRHMNGYIRKNDF